MSFPRSFLRGPLTRFATAAGPHVLLGLGRSWRVRHVGGELVDRSRLDSGPVLYAFTHGVLLPLAFTHRNRAIQVLISESRDGEIIARITASLGFGAVRGSTSHGGERAIIRLASKGREGYDLAMTPDGPRGPRGSVTAGVLLVAARAEIPIVPIGVAAKPAFRAGSWDRFLVPAPFARVWVVYREPITVPRHASEGVIADLSKRVGTAMAAGEEEARSYAIGDARPSRALQVPS